MITMPPRHGKSELVSKLFAGYYVYVHPDRWVGLVSYGAEMAYTFSRAARDNYTHIGEELKGDAASVKNWETGKGGGLWAAGIGGAITGKGYHLGIIDDPIKNAEEAGSTIIRKRNEEWLDSVWGTRQEPGNAQIIITTRWGKKDPAGYILSKELDSPENWHIVNFQAIKDSDNLMKHPDTCTTENDPRNEGEALCPERYSLKKLKKFFDRINSYFWNSLFQQNPITKSGLVYFAFTNTTIGPHSSELDHSKIDAFYHSHDFGGINQVWLLFAKIKDIYYLIHEEMLPRGTTKERAERIKSIINNYLQPWILRYELDNVELEQAIKLAWRNKVISGYGGSASEEQQRIDLRAAGLPIRRINKKLIQNVSAQINYANTMLESGEVVICSDMLKIIDQLENCIYNDQGEIQDKSIWHFLDALRYFAAGVSRKGWVR